MRKLLNNPLVVGLMVLFAVGLGFWPQIQERLAASPAGPIEAAAPEPTAPEPVTPDRILPERIAQILTTIRVPETARDLFRFPEIATTAAAHTPAAEAVLHTETVRLSAIWRQSGADLALLNDRVTAVGERLGGIELAEVTPEGVWLLHQGNRTLLPLGQQHTFEFQPDHPPAPLP